VVAAEAAEPRPEKTVAPVAGLAELSLVIQISGVRATPETFTEPLTAWAAVVVAVRVSQVMPGEQTLPAMAGWAYSIPNSPVSAATLADGFPAAGEGLAESAAPLAVADKAVAVLVVQLELTERMALLIRAAAAADHSTRATG
jgi:hypothetical protein